MAAGARKERKVVTVVFADLVGVTARAETLDPEDGEAELERALAFWRPVGATGDLDQAQSLAAAS